MGLSILTDRSALWDIFHHSRQCIMGLSITLTEVHCGISFITAGSALWDLVSSLTEVHCGISFITAGSALWHLVSTLTEMHCGISFSTAGSALWVRHLLTAYNINESISKSVEVGIICRTSICPLISQGSVINSQRW